MTLRACNVCGRLTPKARCPEHQRKPWQGSTRREKVRSGSAQQKRARYVIERDLGICHVCGLTGADQADHVLALAEGGADEYSNMAPIHATPCHAEKTQAEARRARRGGDELHS